MNNWEQLMSNELLGKTREEAIESLNMTNADFRIVREDINYSIITCDMKPDRINLELDNNIITAVNFG